MQASLYLSLIHIYPEALNRIADEVTEMRQTLENSGKFELNDIGTIILNEDGNYTFEPCEAGILTPELYGLGGLNMLPLAQISAEEVQKTEDSAASIIDVYKRQRFHLLKIIKTATIFC